ncbi:PEPxxWA-CTERM sorting domain-containing protein [Polymorphobacter fuscus]|uniref:PEPxxWA-CTERM sorting domain-containing protein n=2 Tax=Sandarakinorhabdus fusca TaxID=1439888 RepID=A0A7C9KHQ5_9SPHN|nr:PEP-CTERM sorting domain-containing protein [Polymorphobacter fuscus]MQT16599.1 PEPxxWA-CTERM sorting domain-containing protein [Polymorphobacter fuscus]
MAVPEPSSWAMMTAGFGLSGAAMRRQRKALAKAA